MRDRKRILRESMVEGRIRPCPGWTAWLFSLLIFGASPTPLSASYPLEKGPYLIFQGDNTTMTVLWQLDRRVRCTIEWGEDTNYDLGDVQTVEYDTDHQHAYTLTGLAPSTKYFYRVTASRDVVAGSFHTAPTDDATSVKFFAYGDTRSYPEDHDAVAEGIIAAYSSDDALHTLILSMGDLVDNGDSASDWDAQFFNQGYDNIQSMLAHLPYQACMGNHEQSGVLFQKYFPYPYVGDRYWSFDYGPAHFTVIDQYVDYGPGSAQLAWIEADLAATSKRWRFLYFHAPGWSAGGHENNAAVQNYIQPLCEQYGVRFVFAGHNHYYARAVYNGVQHITTGGGGAPLRTPDPGYPYIVAAARAHHFCEISIDDDWLIMTVREPDGTIIDTITEGPPVGVEAIASGRRSPSVFLSPPFPNPFAENTSVRFVTPHAGLATLDLFDIRGRRVRQLLSEQLNGGMRAISWNGRDDSGRPVPAGVYLFRLRASGETRSVQSVLLR